MKISRAAGYAIQALVVLARQKAGAGLTSAAIAATHNLPDRFLLKALRPLAAMRILVSVKGPHGGYRLARPAEEITLLEVVEAVDGPIQAEVPPMWPPQHKDWFDGRLQAVCDNVRDQVRAQMEQVSIADLARGRGSRTGGTKTSTP